MNKLNAVAFVMLAIAGGSADVTPAAETGLSALTLRGETLQPNIDTKLVADFEAFPMAVIASSAGQQQQQQQQQQLQDVVVGLRFVPGNGGFDV